MLTRVCGALAKFVVRAVAVGGEFGDEAGEEGAEGGERRGEDAAVEFDDGPVGGADVVPGWVGADGCDAESEDADDGNDADAGVGVLDCGIGGGGKYGGGSLQES